MQIINIVILIMVITVMFGDKISSFNKDIYLLLNYIPVVIVLIYYIKYYKFYYLMHKIFKNIKIGNMEKSEKLIATAEEKGVKGIKDEIILYFFAISKMRLGKFLESNQILDNINRKFLTKSFMARVDILKCINLYFMGEKAEIINIEMEKIVKKTSVFYLLKAILVKSDSIENIKSDFFQDRYSKFLESYLKVMYYKKVGKYDYANKIYNELLKKEVHKIWILQLKNDKLI